MSSSGNQTGGDSDAGAAETASSVVGGLDPTQTQHASSIQIAVPEVPGYRFTHPLGTGGQGQVWQAIHLDQNRKVALKIIRFESKDDTQAKARFEQERRILGLLEHPNIVRVIEHGELAGGRLWHATEYVGGETLDAYVDRIDKEAMVEGESVRRGGFPLEPVLRLFVEICDAVHTAHQVGVIHRDLKPSNIIVDDDGRPHVLDFGIARSPTPESPDALTLTGEFMGSPVWSSPEQVEARPERIDVRTDVYSLGVLLYRLLTGVFPYDVSGSMAQVFDAIRHADPTPPRKHVTFLDDELEAVILKTLAKERERRYQSVQAFREDLERYLRDEPVRAKGEGRWYHFRKFVSRHRVAAASLAVAFVLSGAWAGISSWLYIAEREATRQATEARTLALRNLDQRNLALAAETQAKRETQRMLAESKMQTARMATQRGDWRRALTLFREAIETGCENVIEAELGIVNALDALNQIQTALDKIETLAARGDLGALRGAVLLMQGELTMARPGFQEDGIDLIHEALQEGLDGANEAYARALTTEALPEFVDHLQKALEQDPFHRHAPGMLAVGYFLSGDPTAAQRVLEQAAAVFPDDPSVRVFLAVVYATQAERERAYDVVEELRGQMGDEQANAMRLVVDIIDVVITLVEGGETIDEKELKEIIFGKFSSASASLARSSPGGTNDFAAVRFPPAIQRTGGFYMRGTFLMLAGEFEGALREFDKAARNSGEGAALMLYGGLLARVGRYREAADALWAAAEAPCAFPVQPKALTLAIGAEIKDLQSQNIALDRNAPSANRILAGIRRRFEAGPLRPSMTTEFADTVLSLDAPELARTILMPALASTPHDPTMLYRLARAEFELGAYGPAIEAAAAALQQSPKHEQARRLLYEAHRHLGDIGPPDAPVPVEEFLSRIPKTRPAKTRSGT